jgi:hypothetical protein
MKNLIVASLFFVALAACQNIPQPKSATEPPLLAYFKPIQASDTLQLELPAQGETDTPGDTIPAMMFFSSLDSTWLRDIEHVATPGEAAVHSQGRFPLAKGYEGCIVEVRQHWFKHWSLLVYDQQRHAFTDRQTVAEWYGGEGGQVLTGSWLFDYDADGSKDLVRREIEHSMRMDKQGEPIESNVERGSLWLFKDGKFTPSPTLDTSAVVRRFPIRSVW